MKIKIVLPNKSNLLKPEMFANITIHHTEGKSIPSIPASALINDNQKHLRSFTKTKTMHRSDLLSSIKSRMEMLISRRVSWSVKSHNSKSDPHIQKLMDMKNAKLNQTVN